MKDDVPPESSDREGAQYLSWPPPHSRVLEKPHPVSHNQPLHPRPDLSGILVDSVYAWLGTCSRSPGEQKVYFTQANAMSILQTALRSSY